MSKHTRRDFLKHTAAAGGALALGPLGASFAQEAAAPAAPEAAVVAPANMVIARWKAEAGAYPDEMKTMAVKMTEEVIKALGGMGRFVSKGHVVWIKPNMAWDRAPEFAANTNPDVVATLVRLCLEAGAKTVKVGDRTCNDAMKSYPSSGIEDAAKAAGAEVIYLDDSRFKDVELKGERLDRWPVYPEIIETDLVINVPIAKHHSLAKATLCMKNYMGVVGGERGMWHQDLPTCLCDITAYMKPQLCVLDALRILTDHGPTGGNLADVKQLNTMAAGTDIVALDVFGAELMGHKPEEILSIAKAKERQLGQVDYRVLQPRDLEVA